MARNPRLKYDIAVSFATEDLRVAKKISEALKNKRLDVYYYPKRNQASDDLNAITTHVYRNGTKYGLIILSKHYPHKKWTQNEWKALLRARKLRNITKIFVIRLDNTSLQGLSKSQIYIPWQNNPNAIANQIKEKIHGPRTWHLTLIKVGVILFLIIASWLCFYLVRVY